MDSKYKWLEKIKQMRCKVSWEWGGWFNYSSDPGNAYTAAAPSTAGNNSISTYDGNGAGCAAFAGLPFAFVEIKPYDSDETENLFHPSVNI